MKFLKYAKNHKGELILAVALIFIAVIAGIIPYFYVNSIVGSLISGTLVKSQLITWILLIFGFLMLKAITYIIGLTYSHKAAYGILYEMRKYFSTKLEQQPLGDVQNTGVGYYKKKLIDDIGALEINFAHMFVEGIPNIIIPVVVLVIIFITDWRLGLLSLASIPICLFSMSLVMKTGISKMGQYYKAQADLNKTIVEYVSGIEVVKIFGKTSDSYDKFVSDVEAYKNYTYDWAKSTWLQMGIIGKLLPCTMILTLPIGALLTYYGYVALSTFIFVILLDISIGTPLLKALMFLPQIPITNKAVDEIEEMISKHPIITGANKNKIKNYDISFDKVHFAYDKTDVLKDINIEIKEGTLNAIIGPSGGGKSTLAKLLVHYWDVKEGSIKVGGVDIKEYDPTTLMDAISFVNQDNFLFDDTIYNNILVGNPKATKEQVEAAAKAAACTDFISQLPNGINTNVGIKGGKLSGGERQRITIARAILKDSPIVILDEATAFTDIENEDIIQEAINNLMVNKTVIIIAHRLRTTVDVDNIIVVNEGKIEATGRHQLLLENCNSYKELWDANEKAINWQLGG